MQTTQIPSKFVRPFAEGGARNPIPDASQISITPGAASLTDGFPPATRTPIESGGTPPDGLDFNGLFYMVTAWDRWQAVGGPVFFDQTFANAVGGYPRGAQLGDPNDPSRFWLSSIEANTHNPDAGDTTGWLHVTPPAFTPVRQGGGLGGQGNNNLFIGYTQAGKVRLTVDNTDFGPLAFESWVDANYAKPSFVTQTDANRAASVDQNYVLRNSGYSNARQNFQPSDGQQVNSTLAVQAGSHGGFLLLIASLNHSGVQPGACWNQIYFDSTIVNADYTNQSQTAMSVVAIAPNSYHTVQQVFISSSSGGQPWSYVGMNFSYLFVAN